MKLKKYPLKKLKPPYKVDEEVKLLQRELKAIGIDIGKDGVDGKFGDDTEEAVKQAQKVLKESGPFTPGVVDKKFADALNKLFSATKIGQLIDNRRKKFENKEEAIQELRFLITNAKRPENKISRLRRNKYYEMLYVWLKKKYEEASDGPWKGIPGYTSSLTVPLEEEYFAVRLPEVDDQMRLLIESGTNEITSCAPCSSEDRMYLQDSPRPDNLEGEGEIEESIEINLPIASVFFTDLLYMPNAELLADLEKQMMEVKVDAIANLGKALGELELDFENIEKINEIRLKIDAWRAKVDEELGEAGKKTSGRSSENENDLVKFITDSEAIRLKKYNDSGGEATIGIGHLITKAELKQGYILIKGKKISIAGGLTKQQALDLRAQDLEFFIRAVDDNVTVELNKCQRIALISFAFNLGAGRFKQSILPLINAGKFKEALDKMGLYVKVKVRDQKTGLPVIDPETGRPKMRKVQGLVNRRAKERKMFLKNPCK